MNNEQQKIEALLFYRNEPVSITWLARHLGVSKANIADEIASMEVFYSERGMEIIIVDDEVSLVTNRVFSGLINSIEKQEEAKELSKQALETLSIIVYKKEVPKSEIDFIRGVNSMYILRNLLVRGLIAKKTNPEDRRSPLYVPSIDLFSFLGISRVEELPNYEACTKKLREINEQYRAENSEEE